MFKGLEQNKKVQLNVFIQLDFLLMRVANNILRDKFCGSSPYSEHLHNSLKTSYEDIHLFRCVV